MNKNVVIGIVALLLIAGGVYAMQNKKTSAPVMQTDKQAVNEAEEFAKAMESGKPTICTMTKDSDVMEYSIKGKKMRIKTTSTLPDDKGISKTTTAHMINDEKYFYTWDETTKQGTKMSMVVPSPSANNSVETSEIAPKFDSQEDYDELKNDGYTINCKTGIIDDLVFTPPTNINFIDPSEMMKAIPSPDAEGNFDMSKLQELQKQYGGE